MTRPLTSRLAVAIVLAAAFGLSACGQKEASAPQAAAPAGPPPTPTLDQLKGASVTGVFEQPITLAGGKYEGEPAAPGAASRPTAMIWEPTLVFGDVDGSPGSEAVAVLSSNGGGSGEFVYVAVFGVRDGQLVNLGTAPVGDRAKVRSVWLEKGRIVMDLVEVGPKDAACCGTQLARKTFALEGGALKQTASDVMGTVTIGTIAATEWQLAQMDGQPLAAGVKPPVIHFEIDGVRGFAGCNRFTAPVKEVSPGVIQIGAVAATKMACPPEQMDLEQAFLAELGKVSGYTFMAGQLALTWQEKERPGLLLFSK
jgi:heat shock protein HslJ